MPRAAAGGVHADFGSLDLGALPAVPRTAPAAAAASAAKQAEDDALAALAL